MSPQPDDVEPEPVVVRVRCRVHAPADHGRLTGAVLRVSLEDVSLADAPAVVVASAQRPLRTSDDLAEPVELSASLSGRRTYTVRAHVSRTGERQVRVADLLSTSSHPVRAVPGTVDVDVELREV
ncbi:YbaY family lipoprotein [Terrabacter carboxydivorans]|uniref:Uncharacterized protein n=1 Tax=Terrabacter carboxydivorans TaxID=619730 RepID=A0ABP5XVS1_9MICO